MLVSIGPDAQWCRMTRCSLSKQKGQWDPPGGRISSLSSKANYYPSCGYWTVPFSEVLRIEFWTVREEKKLQVKYFICRNWSDIFQERSTLLEVLTHFYPVRFNKRIDLLFWFSVNSIDWKPWAFSERSAMIWLGLKVFNDLLTRDRRMHGAWEESSGSLDDFGYNMLRYFLKALV